jgi:hypothetical protein
MSNEIADFKRYDDSGICRLWELSETCENGNLPFLAAILQNWQIVLINTY